MGGRSGQSTSGGGGGGANASGGYQNAVIQTQFPNETGLENKTFLKLAGIPDDFNGVVNIRYDSSERVLVNINDNGIDMTRRINVQDKTINNDYFRIDSNSIYKGQGAKIFESQVKTAQKAGYNSIYVQAAGYKNDYYNGYYTWARLGYMPRGNGSLASVRNIKNITGVDYGNFQTMMRTTSGIKAWKEHGSAFTGIFDLKKGSESMKTLNNYIKNKKQN
jgi:hypothetical protein